MRVLVKHEMLSGSGKESLVFLPLFGGYLVVSVPYGEEMIWYGDMLARLGHLYQASSGEDSLREVEISDSLAELLGGITTSEKKRHATLPGASARR